MKTLATDLDGTLYLDNVLINGVQYAYKSLILNNFKIFHTTNNSSQSTDVIASKLSNLLSIDIDIESIVTPLVVLKEFLKNKNYSLYVYGSKEIKDFVSNITNTVKDLDNSDFIIMGRVESPSQDELDNIAEFIGSQRGYPSAFLLPEYIDEANELKEIDDDLDSLFEEIKTSMWLEAQKLTITAKEIAMKVNSQENKEERDKILNLAKDAARNAGLQGAIAAGWEKGWNEGIASKS